MLAFLLGVLKWLASFRLVNLAAGLVVGAFIPKTVKAVLAFLKKQFGSAANAVADEAKKVV